MIIANHIRGYAYLFGVLQNQQADPFCSKCKALVNTANAAQQDLANFEREHADLPAELRSLLAQAKTARERLVLMENASGQKKAGNCKLPEGVCFVKSARKLLLSLTTPSSG